nr:hypothetical protein [Tanacetum cinerariifolium]
MAPFTFSDTHNMIAFLTKSDASEGVDQIVDFLNAHMIQYALMSNDVVRLQALIDRKKLIITEDTIRQALRLDDADGVDYLPNEEIFAELARMGYEKPSTKLKFYKALFSTQWKFLIHTILQCMSAKRTIDCMQDTDEAELAKVEEVLKVVTTAKLMTKVVTTATQVPNPSALRKKRCCHTRPRGDNCSISNCAFREAELNANINWDDVMEQVKRREKQDNTVMRYQALKRKHVTEAQARKNMMIYLKNMVGFKMDFIKGMTYTEIRHIFAKHYNSIQAFLEKGEEEVTEQEEGSKRKGDSLEQKAAKKQRINEEADELKTHLQIIVNDDDDVYCRKHIKPDPVASGA